MNPKMDEAALRRKVGSLKTMLSRERLYTRELERIADKAVQALEETNNGEVKEAVRSLGEARQGLKAWLIAVSTGAEVARAEHDEENAADAEADSAAAGRAEGQDDEGQGAKK